MDRVLHFVLAIVVVAILALLVSHDRQKIRIRYVVQLLVIEVLLAWFFLNSDIGLGFVKGFSEMFEKLLGFANEGTNFVFGGMNDKGLAFFFLKVLCPIVFISALIAFCSIFVSCRLSFARSVPSCRKLTAWASWSPSTP